MNSIISETKKTINNQPVKKYLIMGRRIELAQNKSLKNIYYAAQRLCTQ
jgi:hypothetical protein